MAARRWPPGAALDVARRLGLALALIAGASAVLLWSDRGARRRGEGAPAAAALAGAADPAGAPAGLRRTWRARVVLYLETPPAEEALEGIHQGLDESGLVAGRDYALTTTSAQGDMATLVSILDGLAGDGTDLLLTLSTPTLQAAVQRVRHMPIVFTFVANPLLAGAGRSDEDHLPNVTGVYTVGAYVDMAALIAEAFPSWRRVGTLFTPAEVNSVFNKDLFVAAAAERGLAVDTVAASSPGELSDAALALAGRPIDAIVQIADNQTMGGFTAIARAGRRAGKPVVGFTTSAVEQGAVFALSVDYRQAGRDAAAKAVQVMRGASPAAIPFSQPSHKELIVSVPNAALIDLTVPAVLLARADRVVR